MQMTPGRVGERKTTIFSCVPQGDTACGWRGAMAERITFGAAGASLVEAGIVDRLLTRAQATTSS